jgi:HD-like signal output (HDOD) protein
MAYILLLDDNDVAGRAMQGILARGNHTCLIIHSTEQAWRLLREGVIFDLMFMELKVAKQETMGLLQRIRDDWFWKNLPVVIYTYDTDAKNVKRALGLRVQNYLVKPYNDQSVHSEIAKTRLNPWRNLHFEEIKSFCAQLGLTPEALCKLRRAVLNAYEEAAKIFPLWAEERENTEVFARLNALAADAEAAGIWAGVDFIYDLRAQAERDNWAVFKTCGEYFDYAGRLIFCQLNPTFVPDCLRSAKELEEAREAADRARWMNIDVDANGSVVKADELEKQIASLPMWPVVDAAAASFQMAADGRAASMGHVMERIGSDPGLCAVILSAANHVDREDMSVIEDPNAAAGMLGELKLHTLAKTLQVCHERHMHLPPMTWTNYWMFLNGVSKVSQFVCNYLEFGYLSSQASVAGLLHDLGKLVLLKLHPFGFQAIARYAQDKKIPLPLAEKKHLGCTSRDLGVKFAEASGLPAVYTNVMRWVERPDQASADADMVAMVSLARQVCLHNHVGYCGDTPGDLSLPLASTPAWRAIQPRIFPSFDLKKFEQQAATFCVELKQELSGKSRGRAVIDRAVA